MSHNYTYNLYIIHNKIKLLQLLFTLKYVTQITCYVIIVVDSLIVNLFMFIIYNIAIIAVLTGISLPVHTHPGREGALEELPGPGRTQAPPPSPYWRRARCAMAQRLAPPSVPPPTSQTWPPPSALQPAAVVV